MLVHYIIDIAGYARFGFDDQKQLLDQADILLLDTDMCPLCQRFTSKVFFLVNGTLLINAGWLFLFFRMIFRRKSFVKALQKHEWLLLLKGIPQYR